jgi:hypothetical protein
MESMVSAGSAVFEHPKAHTAKSAMNSALLINAPDACLKIGWLNSFEPDSMSIFLPSIMSAGSIPLADSPFDPAASLIVEL